MSRASSPSSGRRYGTARVCQLWEVPRSTVYARRARASRPAQPAAKRGPKGAGTDIALTEQIRAVLACSPFMGEGYRKAWERLRLAGVRTSKGRVLRLMRAAGPLAPTRVGCRRGPRNHDGTITTDRPDELWGTDATACLTHPRGQRHGLHRRRPLHAGVRRHPRGSPRHALRGARAAPPGAAGAPRRLRAGRRRRAQPAPRPRQPVPQRPFPGRAALPRHPLEPGPLPCRLQRGSGRRARGHRGRVLAARAQLAASRFAVIARSMQERGHKPLAVAHFLNRVLFCLFGEDVGPDRTPGRRSLTSYAVWGRLRQRTGPASAEPA